MAARSVRCQFYNRTTATITKTSENVNWGIITDPWYIPNTIAPNSLVEWRTESDGLLSGLTEGTEGFAHFAASDGMATNNIVVHWDNPAVGSNNCSMSVTLDFTGAPSTYFTCKCGILKAYYPNLDKMLNDGDVEAWIDGILFPPYIVSNGNFAANDTTALFVLDTTAASGQASSPLFGGSSTKSLTEKLNTERNSGQWAGTWVSDEVAVTITDLGGGQMQAHVTDRIPPNGPDLEFTETFQLWGIGTSLVHTIVHGAAQTLGVSPVSVAAALQHAVVVTTDEQKSRSPQGGGVAFNRAITASLKAQGQLVSTAKIDRVSAGIGLAIEQSKSTVSLSHGVYLTLYDVFDGNNKIDTVMHYERHAFGVVIRKARLEFVVAVR